MIKIDKQSLNHKFRGFILIRSVPWGQLRTKFPCHTTFLHQRSIFFSFASVATLMLLNGHYESDGFILTIWILSMWSCKSKVDEVHSRALIYPNLDIPRFCIPLVWRVIFHLHSDITTWNKANITGKIFIYKIKYLKTFFKFIVIFSIGLAVLSSPSVYTIVRKSVVNFSKFSKYFFRFTRIFFRNFFLILLQLFQHFWSNLN